MITVVFASIYSLCPLSTLNPRQHHHLGIALSSIMMCQLGHDSSVHAIDVDPSTTRCLIRLDAHNDSAIQTCHALGASLEDSNVLSQPRYRTI
ncbi:hypothetical protein DB88DRAFT_127497 [Papiliotrema laurentii]|uniref:Uncharacterized protein n=1 Tax=Papiliotrema laurentii TaxID=5418 RepID=A0AAD9CTT4_PAPLA|nr:hypothetical protein DB88DRAFT_129763 [Papiliotrema laurentii]KAK1920709.1 hypothetical protein DB88DRAFT_127497 [Papiliotrema laurentii]